MFDPTPLRLPRSYKRTVLTIVGSLGFVVLGIVMVSWGLSAELQGIKPILYLLVGILSIVVFGLFAVLVVRMACRPPLVVDDRGITDNTSALSIGFIPWEQALGFRPAPVATMGATNDLVHVVWADEQWVWAHMGSFCKLFNRANRSFGVPPAPLSVDFLTINGQQLALLLLEQRRMRRPDLPEASGMPPAQPDHPTPRD